MEGYICPKCGKRTMIKKETDPGEYKLICSECGFQHRRLPKDESKKGFV